MKIYSINGGPRKNWNTARMLKSFSEGALAVSPNVDVETVHLFDLKYTGCTSCFACKRNASTYGKCALKDDIYDLLEKVSYADGVVLGSPIYFHDITAQLRGFLERFWFPYHSFEKGEDSTAPKKIRSAMIYTMNVTEEQMRRGKYDVQLATTERYMAYHFHYKPQIIYAFDTYEFDDYGKYKASIWDEAHKAELKRTQFPRDCDAAYGAGAQMVNDIITNSQS